MSEVFLTRDEIEHPYANLTVMLEDKRRKAEQMRRTVFARITASPEVLAPKFVYHVTSFLDGIDKPKKVWYSTLIQGRSFASETEAKRATVEKLKEVENG